MDISARDAALQRIAFVFARDPQQLSDDLRFGHELKASPPNDFRSNEFDRLSEDVQQMIDGKRGDDIATVEQFCQLVESYAAAEPQGWKRLLASWKRERQMESAPGWRRTVWRLMGI